MKNNDVAGEITNIFAEVSKQKKIMLEKIKDKLKDHFEQHPEEKTSLIKSVVRDEAFRYVPKLVQDVITTYLDVSAVTSLEKPEVSAVQTIDIIASALKKAMLTIDLSNIASGKTSVRAAKVDALTALITNTITLSLLMQHACEIDTDCIIKDMENHTESMQGVINSLKQESDGIKQKFNNADEEFLQFAAELNLQKMTEDVVSKVKGKAGANNEI